MTPRDVFPARARIARTPQNPSISRKKAYIAVALFHVKQNKNIVTGPNRHFHFSAADGFHAARKISSACPCARLSPAATMAPPFDGSPPSQLVMTPPAPSTIGIKATMS